MRTLVSSRARSRDIVVDFFPGQRPNRLSVPDRKMNGMLSLVCAKLRAQRVHDYRNRLGNRFRQVFDIDGFHRAPCLRQTTTTNYGVSSACLLSPSQGVSKTSLVSREHETRHTGVPFTVRPGLPRGARQRRDGKTEAGFGPRCSRHDPRPPARGFPVAFLGVGLGDISSNNASQIASMSRTWSQVG